MRSTQVVGESAGLMMAAVAADPRRTACQEHDNCKGVRSSRTWCSRLDVKHLQMTGIRRPEWDTSRTSARLLTHNAGRQSEKARLVVTIPVVVETCCSYPAARNRLLLRFRRSTCAYTDSGMRDLASPGQIECGRQLVATICNLGKSDRCRDPAARAIVSA